MIEFRRIEWTLRKKATLLFEWMMTLQISRGVCEEKLAQLMLGCCCKRSEQLSLGRGRETLPLQQVFAEGVEVQRVGLGMQEHGVVQKGAVKLAMATKEAASSFAFLSAFIEFHQVPPFIFL
jgi:hypothetical protein